MTFFRNICGFPLFSPVWAAPHGSCARHIQMADGRMMKGGNANHMGGQQICQAFANKNMQDVNKKVIFLKAIEKFHCIDLVNGPMHGIQNVLFSLKGGPRISRGNTSTAPAFHGETQGGSQISHGNRKLI